MRIRDIIHVKQIKNEKKDGRSKPNISVTSLRVNGLSQLSENIVRHD